VYLFGGHINNEANCAATDKVQMYDGTKWIKRQKMPLYVSGHDCIKLDNDRALVCGGRGALFIFMRVLFVYTYFGVQWLENAD
jgi:hypothetical protein